MSQDEPPPNTPGRYAPSQAEEPEKLAKFAPSTETRTQDLRPKAAFRERSITEWPNDYR